MMRYEGYSKWEVLSYELVLSWVQSHVAWHDLIKGLIENGSADPQDISVTQVDDDLLIDYEPLLSRTSARFLWEDIGRVLCELALGHDNPVTRWGLTNIMMRYITERIDK